MSAFTAQFLMAHPRLWRTKHTSIVIAFTGLSSGGAKKNEGVHVSALGLFDVFFFSLLPRSSPRLGRRPSVGRELMPFGPYFRQFSSPGSLPSYVSIFSLAFLPPSPPHRRRLLVFSIVGLITNVDRPVSVSSTPGGTTVPFDFRSIYSIFRSI